MKVLTQYIEQIDIRFLLQFAAFPPTYLGPDECRSLLHSIEQHGIKEPLVLAVNPETKRVRLDVGNHRVYLCACIGYTTLPTVAYVSNMEIPNPENGLHLYDYDAILVDEVELPYHCKPSEVMRIE